MKNPNHEAFRNAGFTPPNTAWTHPDPRGEEYGYYSVELTDCDFIWVTYTPVDTCGTPMLDKQYGMRFHGVKHFSNWAQHAL